MMEPLIIFIDKNEKCCFNILYKNISCKTEKNVQNINSQL